jgi:hypothetical protein
VESPSAGERTGQVLALEVEVPHAGRP